MDNKIRGKCDIKQILINLADKNVVNFEGLDIYTSWLPPILSMPVCLHNCRYSTYSTYICIVCMFKFFYYSKNCWNPCQTFYEMVPTVLWCVCRQVFSLRMHCTQKTKLFVRSINKDGWHFLKLSEATSNKMYVQLGIPVLLAFLYTICYGI